MKVPLGMARPAAWPRRGFSLIELIVVLVILGILAAFAIPRFFGVTRDAREAAIKALANELRTTLQVVHGQATMRGKLAVSGDTIDLDGSTVTLVNGYPDASASGIGATMTNLDGYRHTYGDAVTPAKFSPASFTGKPVNCQVAYTPAPEGGTASVAISDPLDCS